MDKFVPYSFKAINQKGNAVAAAKGVYGSEDYPLQTFEENEGQLLNGDWIRKYASIGLEAPTGTEVHYLTDSARQYINALEWIYKYYCVDSEAVDFNWMYPYSTAPLFGSVAVIFTGFDSKPQSIIRPTVYEQLAIVLPPSSYHLIPKCKERQLLSRAPWLFPKGELKYYSFGKRFTWECEAHIPIPTITDVRSILK